MYVSLVHIPLTLLYNFCKATFKLNTAFYVYTKDIGALSFLFEVNCLLRIDRNVSLFGFFGTFFLCCDITVGDRSECMYRQGLCYMLLI